MKAYVAQHSKQCTAATQPNTAQKSLRTPPNFGLGNLRDPAESRMIIFCLHLRWAEPQPLAARSSSGLCALGPVRDPAFVEAAL